MHRNGNFEMISATFVSLLAFVIAPVCLVCLSPRQHLYEFPQWHFEETGTQRPEKMTSPLKTSDILAIAVKI